MNAIIGLKIKIELKNERLIFTKEAGLLSKAEKYEIPICEIESVKYRTPNEKFQGGWLTILLKSDVELEFHGSENLRRSNLSKRNFTFEVDRSNCQSSVNEVEAFVELLKEHQVRFQGSGSSLRKPVSFEFIAPSSQAKSNRWLAIVILLISCLVVVVKNTGSGGINLEVDGVIGKWYEDNQSPDWLDVTYTISRVNGTYYIHRLNGDGSTGRYKLTRDGKYLRRVNNKFGAYYGFSGKDLVVYDKLGKIGEASYISP